MAGASIPFFNRSYLTGVIILIVSFVFTQATLAYTNETTEIRRVSFASKSDGTGIVVRVHANRPVNAYSEPRLSGSNRLEFIVFNAALSESYQTDTPSDPITNLDIHTRKGHLVFSFALDDGAAVQTAAYLDQESNDILIGITLLGDLPASQPVSQPAADLDVSLPEAEPESIPVASAPSRKKRRERGSHREDASVPVRQASHTEISGDRWVLDTIVVDAGHGGHDSGAVAHGVKEKDINLKVALKLGHYLENILKVNVVYTRTDDRFIELQERGHIANEAGAKLFISIHANAAPYSRMVRGTETYILGLHKSDKAKEVMERENNVIKLEEDPNKYEDFYQGSILRTLALSANLRLSEKLAAEIEKQFSERARRQSRGVKQAGLIVLWAASMPAVLVELGYLTNRFEANYLNSEEGQDYLASAIFRAVRDFKYEYEKGLELSAQN